MELVDLKPILEEGERKRKLHEIRMKELINLEEALPKGLNPANLTQALKEKKQHLIPIQPPENLQ